MPSQLRDISFIGESLNPEKLDTKREVARRLRGAFGFPAPYGHYPVGMDSTSFNLDIVGGAVGSLCEAFRAVARSEEHEHRINLLFDHETDDLTVQSPYPGGTLHVQVKRPAPVLIRLPSWVPRSAVKLTGATALPRLCNGYLYIASPPPTVFTVSFPLPRQELVLRYRTRRIRCLLEGDQVIQMENFGADRTYFDAIS